MAYEDHIDEKVYTFDCSEAAKAVNKLIVESVSDVKPRNPFPTLGPGFGKTAACTRAWDIACAASINGQLTRKRTTMKKVTKRVFYGYDDLTDMCDEQIFSLIRDLRNQHTNLKDIAIMSIKAARKRMEIMKQIEKLVTYVDTRK